jgi:hypothetical protein
MQIEAKLQALGLVLPAAPKAPPGIKLSFAWTRTRGNRIYLSGHSAQTPDGSFIGPFGKVPTEVSLAICSSVSMWVQPHLVQEIVHNLLL